MKHTTNFKRRMNMKLQKNAKGVHEIVKAVYTECVKSYDNFVFCFFWNGHNVALLFLVILLNSLFNYGPKCSYLIQLRPSNMSQRRPSTGFKPMGVNRAVKRFTESGGTTDLSWNDRLATY